MEEPRKPIADVTEARAAAAEHQVPRTHDSRDKEAGIVDRRAVVTALPVPALRTPEFPGIVLSVLVLVKPELPKPEFWKPEFPVPTGLFWPKPELFMPSLRNPEFMTV
jgi:hypothetical protein